LIAWPLANDFASPWEIPPESFAVPFDSECDRLSDMCGVVSDLLNARDPALANEPSPAPLPVAAERSPPFVPFVEALAAASAGAVFTSAAASTSVCAVALSPVALADASNETSAVPPPGPICASVVPPTAPSAVSPLAAALVPSDALAPLAASPTLDTPIPSA